MKPFCTVFHWISAMQYIGALKWDHIENLGIFQIAWNISRRPGVFPDCLKFSKWPEETFQRAWKVVRWLGIFQMTWKVSRWPRIFPESLEIFQIAWKISRWPGKFPDVLESFRIFWTVLLQSGKFSHCQGLIPYFWTTYSGKITQFCKNSPGLQKLYR